jgi:hypothetical protein
VDGANRLELLLTPCIRQDVPALFIQQLSQADPAALHLIIQDRASFHLPENEPRLLPKPPAAAFAALQPGSSIPWKKSTAW